MSAPSMRVAVELGFVRSCDECLKAVASLHNAAVTDPAVTRLTLIPGKQHAHATTDAGGKPLPTSDTNGSEPEDVERLLLFSGPTAHLEEGAPMYTEEP